MARRRMGLQFRRKVIGSRDRRPAQVESSTRLDYAQRAAGQEVEERMDALANWRRETTTSRQEDD